MVVKFDGKTIATFAGTLSPEEIKTAAAEKYPAITSAQYKLTGDTIEFFTKSGDLG